MGFHYENIPAEMKALRQWVCWAGTKLPKNPQTGGNAMSNNPATWGTFQDALDAVERYGLSGVGFMFAPPYFGVDLDKCIEDTDFVDEFVETLGSYAEYSKSGNGVHIICRGALPSGARRKGKVEMYSEGRFFIMTGNLYGHARAIDECTETVRILHQKYLSEPQSAGIQKSYTKISLEDTEVVDMARASKSGLYFEALYDGNWQGAYGSQSEADLALCNILAFWTQRNYRQMDRIFRSSGLYRKKWDESRGGMTYGQKTLEKAVAGTTDVYTGRREIENTVVSVRPAAKKAEFRDFETTDTGNGQRFAYLFGDIIRYMRNRKRWFFWDGKVWCEDTTNEIRRLADKAIQNIKDQAFACDDENKQSILLRHALRTAGNKAKTNMITESEHLRGIAIGTEYFDSQSDLINLQNGIVNLRNGEIIEHSADYHMSRIGYASCAGEGAPKRWLQFLDEITDGNRELQRFLQKAVGYSLTASIREQCAFICFGNGCNGKSTFMDVVATIMGQYAVNMQAESIMVKKSGGAVNSDIARLKGARLVTVAEPEEGLKLNESLMKQLTGGDPVTARFLFGDEFEFRPQFKLWICTNHKPVIRGTDDGIWRRIILVPFTVRIPPEKIDRGLGHKLRKEMPLIARWAVEGCMLWQEEGLSRPACIEAATRDYRAEMDTLAQFCEDCVEDADCPGAPGIKASELYEVYQVWARDTNAYEMTANRFGREIGKRYQKIKTRDGARYTGCKFSLYADNNYRSFDTQKMYKAANGISQFPHM